MCRLGDAACEHNRLGGGQVTIQLVCGEKIFLENIHLAAGACNEQPTFRCATYIHTFPSRVAKMQPSILSRYSHMDALGNEIFSVKNSGIYL